MAPGPRHGARALKWTLFRHASSLNHACSRTTMKRSWLWWNRQQILLWCFNSLWESKYSRHERKPVQASATSRVLPVELVPVPCSGNERSKDRTRESGGNRAYSTVPKFVLGHQQKAVFRLVLGDGHQDWATSWDKYSYLPSRYCSLLEPTMTFSTPPMNAWEIRLLMAGLTCFQQSMTDSCYQTEQWILRSVMKCYIHKLNDSLILCPCTISPLRRRSLGLWLVPRPRTSA